MNNVELIASYWTLAGGAIPHTDKEYSTFDFKDRVDCAARVGFKGLRIWHSDLEHILNTRSLKEMRQILDDNGMQYVEIRSSFWRIGFSTAATPLDAPLKPKPVTSVKEALELVDSFDGKPEDLQLAIPEALLDAAGINMAVITDRILARGWQPDGFTQGPDYRLHRYKKALTRTALARWVRRPFRVPRNVRLPRVRPRCARLRAG